MCGILGTFLSKSSINKLREADALNILKHRGPDASGTYYSPDKQCFLGHQRLSILDLSEAANQPMQRNHGVLVYNGEVYNHDSLRKELNADFTTHSDTETVLWGLHSNGASSLKQLVGMFAGAYYDEQDKSLLLFRDPLGIKPLYYKQLSDGSLLFASEIKALLAFADSIEPAASHELVSQYMVYENYPQKMSLFDNVNMLEPGNLLKATTNTDGTIEIEIETYHYQSPVKQTKVPSQLDYSDLVEITRDLIRQSVAHHLMSDVPLGVYLSGGIDSSLVGTLASQNADNIMAFTGYFDTPDQHYDERPYARLVAKEAGMELVEVPISATDFETHFDDVIFALDEPRMGMGAFSQYMVAQEAAKHRKVILAGHGGDELFGGYPLFKAFWMTQSKLGLSTLVALGQIRIKEWPWIVNHYLNLLKTGALHFAPELFPRHKFNGHFSKDNVFSQDISSDPLQQLNEYYRHVYLPGLLVVEDKISMAHSLETRVPLWTQPLMDWVYQIPISLKIKNGQLKSLLRDVAAPLLPKELMTAPKRGFPTPLRLWFKQDLKDFVQQRLLDTTTPLDQFISKKEIEKLLSSHSRIPLPFALDERRAHKIWILLCLESWMRQYKIHEVTSA